MQWVRGVCEAQSEKKKKQCVIKVTVVGENLQFRGAGEPHVCLCGTDFQVDTEASECSEQFIVMSENSAAFNNKGSFILHVQNANGYARSWGQYCA